MPDSQVLLVEDSDSDALLIKVHLRTDPRFSVTHVETLADASGILGHSSIDVVVLDLNLPDSLGLETFPGRTLYLADFDVERRTISNLKPFANAEGKKVWFAYPRWTKDESEIVYHAGGKLFLYTLADGSTRQVSTDGMADYRYPHGEATPN